MKTRREFLVMVAAAGVTLKFWAPAFASGTNKGLFIHRSVAITQVFGDGIRLTDIAVQYSQPVDGQRLSIGDFTVEGRRVMNVFASSSVDPADKASSGEYVIIVLSPADENALLAKKLPVKKEDDNRKEISHAPKGGPGKAGDIPTYDTFYPEAKVSFEQINRLYASSGATLPPEKEFLTTNSARNLIIDDFKQFEFYDPKTKRSLKYNLFMPVGYDKGHAYPMVVFMHDAGATSNITKTTLYQGLGAVCWASPDDQASRPCFVLAPQYEEIIADDESHTSAMLDTTVNLIHHLSDRYHLDRRRLYATGQSGGCMLSMAMGIKYPDLFAALFLVAGQWDPSRVKPLAHQKLWIIVSQDDEKAWPGQNAIVDMLEKAGAKVTRVEWDGTWGEVQFRQAFRQVDAEKSSVNYVAFSQGTVIPQGESTAGASGHRNTWRIAYGIEPIREWIFRQHKK